jgi:SAM-dependent methyltransferase
MAQVSPDNVKGSYWWVEQQCPICEAPPTKLIGRRGGRAHREGLGVECDVWRCDQCSLIFPNPMPVPIGGLAQHYGMNADDYFEHHDVDTKSLAASSLLRRAEELTGGKGRLLDIGTGRGELLLAARLEGWEPVGIEPSASFAEHTMKHSSLEIRSMAVEECGFDSNNFDVVVLSAVLEHLYNPDQTIREVSRILRPGGALFLDVPNEVGLYFRVGNLYQRLRGRDWVVNTAPTFSPFHVFGFSPRSLRALLSKHNLKPRDWRVYPGEAMVPSRGGAIGELERIAANAITTLSKIGSLGTYIETWAVKSG